MIVERLPGIGLVIVLAIAFCAAMTWRHYLIAETEEHESRRAFNASSEATYAALCGALATLGYKITSSEPDVGTLQFRGGTLGPWIGRLGVECRASVCQLGDRQTEVVIAGHASPADKHGKGMLLYPEGMRSRTARILDQVDATVITHRTIDAALAGQRDDARGNRRVGH